MKYRKVTIAPAAANVASFSNSMFQSASVAVAFAAQQEGVERKKRKPNGRYLRKGALPHANVSNGTPPRRIILFLTVLTCSLLLYNTIWILFVQEVAATPSSQNNINRPLVFVHFHKAGGSSMVSTFKKVLKPWKPNRNGNPWALDDQGVEYIIPFWRCNTTGFEDFLQKAKEQQAQIVATEFNFFTSLSKEEIITKVDLIICFRDPYDRMVSNLFFGNFTQEIMEHPERWISQNFTWNKDGKNKRKPPWQDFQVSHNKPNYYTMFLNGLAEQGHTAWAELNRTHLEIAKERLSWFTAILILEQPQTHTVLQRWLPHNKGLEHKNLNNRSKEAIEKKINMTREEFYKHNALDKELYEYAVQLAHSRR